MLYDYNKIKLYKLKCYKRYSRTVTFEGEFYDFRIDPKTIPEGKYMYHMRHDDNGDWCTPISIEKGVMVNFCGTFITNEPLHLEDYPFNTIYISRVTIDL